MENLDEHVLDGKRPYPDKVEKRREKEKVLVKKVLKK